MIKLGNILKEMLETSNIENDLSPEEIKKEVKSRINSVLKKNNLKPVKTYTTDIGGFHHTEGAGYRLEKQVPGYKYRTISFIKVPVDVVNKVKKEMKEEGIIVVESSESHIQYTINELAPIKAK